MLEHHGKFISAVFRATQKIKWDLTPSSTAKNLFVFVDYHPGQFFPGWSQVFPGIELGRFFSKNFTNHSRYHQAPIGINIDFANG